MRIEDMPSPGVLINGMALRKEANKAIFAAECYLDHDQRKTLASFFLECAKHAAPPKAVPAAKEAE